MPARSTKHLPRWAVNVRSIQYIWCWKNINAGEFSARVKRGTMKWNDVLYTKKPTNGASGASDKSGFGRHIMSYLEWSLDVIRTTV